MTILFKSLNEWAQAKGYRDYLDYNDAEIRRMQNSMTYFVTITSRDLIKGQRCAAGECPGALALIRALRDAKTPASDVLFGTSTIRINFADGTRAEIDTPPALRTFIEDFDAERDVAVPFPFALEFEKPEHTVPLLISEKHSLWFVTGSVYTTNAGFYVIGKTREEACLEAGKVVGISADKLHLTKISHKR